VQSAGDDLISLQAQDAGDAQLLAAALRHDNRFIDVVAGVETVVVRYDIATLSRAQAESRVLELIEHRADPSTVRQRTLEVPINYGGEDGPDLKDVCEHLGITEAEFIALHTGRYTVEMLGFIPGFAYIGGLDARLAVGRLPEPRQSLPAGSVGIAGKRTGLYALRGPGGWPVIGRTRLQLFDADDENPFLLSPGDCVVFVEASDT